jgi:hypothetical protein
MPRREGTGPLPGGGRGRGRRMGGGQGSEGGGQRRGLGPRGECVCPQCGRTAPHSAGEPCVKMTCPACRCAMVRKWPGRTGMVNEG